MVTKFIINFQRCTKMEASNMPLYEFCFQELLKFEGQELPPKPNKVMMAGLELLQTKMQNLIKTRENLNEYTLSSPKLKFNKDMESGFKGITKILKSKAKQFDKAEKAEKDEKLVTDNEDHKEEPHLD